MMYAYIFQSLLALWFFVIHFIPLFPLNDIQKFPNEQSWNRFLFIHWLIQVMCIISQLLHVPYATAFAILYLSLLFFGHIMTWWLPYLFGWPKVFIGDLIDHKVTWRFLPPHKNYPIPDLAYCILGTLCLLALLFSIMHV